MKSLFAVLIISALSLFSFSALADTAPGLSVSDFASQVLASVNGFGGLSAFAKISVVITLIIASMKVTVFDGLIWDRLGKFQVWAAPVLGLIAGIFAQGSSLTLPQALAYISAGAGAVFLHEILDSLKALPGIGPIWVSIITLIESTLGGNAVSASQPQLKS